MRKFRLDSASALELPGLTCALWCDEREYGRSARGERLLLHWWAVGHDPRRALNRCEDCHWEGQGFQMETIGSYNSLDYPVECKTCKGTGRAPVSEWRKL